MSFYQPETQKSIFPDVRTLVQLESLTLNVNVCSVTQGDTHSMHVGQARANSWNGTSMFYISTGHHRLHRCHGISATRPVGLGCRSPPTLTMTSKRHTRMLMCFRHCGYIKAKQDPEEDKMHCQPGGGRTAGLTAGSMLDFQGSSRFRTEISRFRFWGKEAVLLMWDYISYSVLPGSTKHSSLISPVKGLVFQQDNEPKHS